MPSAPSSHPPTRWRPAWRGTSCCWSTSRRCCWATCHPARRSRGRREPQRGSPTTPRPGVALQSPHGRRSMAMGMKTFDRTLEDLGNMIHLEHVNVRVPDQQLATQFYVVALGLTRDPYLMVGLENMWINAGHSQFHLPTAAAQVLRGFTGLVIPDFDELPARLATAAEKLKGTKFSYHVESNYADVTCPWGNRFRLHPPQEKFPRLTLGMPYVEFPVRQGTADGIARFYKDIIGAPSCVVKNGTVAAEVGVGTSQKLIFRETNEP